MNARKTLPAFCFLIAVLLAPVTSCMPKFTVYDSRVPADRTHLNKRALERIAGMEDRGAKSAVTETSPRTRFRIGVLTDTHNDYADFEKAVEQLNRRKDLDFVVLVGDMTNIGMIWEYNQAYAVMRRLRVPLVSVMGNHDAVAFGKQIYADMFGDDNFAFTHKGVRFVAWNNVKLEFERNTHDFASLERQLERKGDERTTVVMSHIPPTETENQIYSSAERVQLQGIFERNGVDVSLNGHIHAYGRVQVKGVDYVIAQRVRDVHYGILTFEVDGTTNYEQCKAGICSAKPKAVEVAKWN